LYGEFEKEHTMKVRDVMTRNVQVVQTTDSVRQAAEQMKRLNVGALPVMSGNDVVGMLTDRDISLRMVAVGRDPETTRVGEILTPEVFFVTEDESIEQAGKVMEEKKIRRLLVRDSQGKAIGILSLGDIAVSVGEDESGELLRSISEPAQPKI
jgi:CBS domain-containing protein